jgi:hypothetical protein
LSDCDIPGPSNKQVFGAAGLSISKGSRFYMAKSVKNLFLGDPLHNEESQHQRLSNFIALAVFSSDAISSVAYATGEIIITLSLAGAMFLALADTFARVIMQPTEMPVGIITAVIGAPFFVYLLVRKKRGAA